MSYEYNLYLNEHKMNVMRAFNWLVENVFVDEIVDNYSPNEFGFNQAALEVIYHDESKFSSDEYYQYDEYFYGDLKDDDRFNMAWLHHIHENPHHWQHWVLVNDDPELGTIALKMDDEYIIEMVCDWWSFSWKTGNLHEIFSWYEKNKDHMVLHEETRKKVEDLLDKIKTKLEEEEK